MAFYELMEVCSTFPLCSTVLTMGSVSMPPPSRNVFGNFRKRYLIHTGDAVGKLAGCEFEVF